MNIINKLIRFLTIGAFIFIATYYYFRRDNMVLISLGLLFLGVAFLLKIIELNVRKRKI